VLEQEQKTMAMQPIKIADIRFEVKDVEIFSIPDIKTRLDTLQNYFFPRLEGLMHDTVELIQEIYGLYPYDRMTITYRPSHRAKARRNVDYGEVHIGLRGRWDRSEQLAAIASLLIFTVEPEGFLYVALTPFAQRGGPTFESAISDLVRNARDQLDPIFALHRVAQSCIMWGVFVNLADAFRTDLMASLMPGYRVDIRSPAYPFPVEREIIAVLQEAFAAMYPLLEASVAIAHGEPHHLSERLESYRQWYRRSLEEAPAAAAHVHVSASPVTLPELDGYQIIRPGLWWAVLARDRWTCCSCGRSSRHEGVLLEVDHILPRSHGGSNAIDNLQTLCHKCNQGKSDRDSTDLRRVEAEPVQGDARPQP
jgi:5-methylcytosine-specific restriction endonuclease McrA